ncbi:MAG: hypothetical protein IPJ41_18085 [Phycisphaerales bacterium]|nr:hypothetical protein [Phycisphaerales bacterium]
MDQISVRKSLRDVIEAMPGEYAGFATALKQFGALVRAESARAYTELLNLHLATAPKDTLGEARHLIEAIDNDLAELGLAIKAPGTGAVSRLTLATTPPVRPGESWFALEPLQPVRGLGAQRLSRPLPTLHVVPQPPRDTSPHRASGR